MPNILRDTRKEAIVPSVVRVLTCLLVALMLCVGIARAEKPTLEPKEPLPASVRQNTKVSFKFTFKDGDDDKPLKVTLRDSGPTNTIENKPTTVSGNPRDGMELIWEFKNLEVGKHKISVEAQGSDGNTVYWPAETDGTRLEFELGVEALGVKIGMMVGGLVVGLVALPFLIYVIARSMNPKGDPSGAARVGLLIGILACGALFIVLFASFYGVYAYAIGVIAALALIVVVLTRR